MERRPRRSSPAATASSSAIRARCSSISGRTSGTIEYLQYRVNNGIPDQITLNINRVPHPPVGAQRCVLRAGAVDARPDDAAGRAALRPRVELLPRADGRPGALLPDGDDVSAHRRASRAITTCGRAAASPTTCSARARRRSRSTSDGIWRRRRTAACSSRSIRPGACRRRRRGRGPIRTATTVADCNLLNPAAQDLTRDRRRSILRRERERELRDGGLRVDARSGAALGVGRALRRLAVGRVGAAGSAAARRRRGRIPAPVAGQLRWSPTTARGRPPRITPCSASTIPADSAAAGRRRRRAARPLQRHAGGRDAAERQLPDAGVELSAIGRRSPTRST